MGIFKASAAFAAAALSCLVFDGARAGEPRPAVTRVALEPAQDGARLLVDTSKALSAKTFFLEGANPRFVVDLPAVRWAFPAGAARRPAGLAEGLRYAHRDGAHSRLVVDLKADGRLVGQSRTRTKVGYRYAFVIAAADADQVEPAPEPILQVAYIAPPKPARTDRVVVIDAGHGGKDSGALGVSGREEKDIALASALALKADLERRGGYKVVLTRDRDVFVPLAERVKIARDAKADLFISLHADSNGSKAATGASIYTLSDSGGARAKGLMDRQDWQVDLGDSPRSSAAEDILVDLTQRETKSISADFADTLADHLAGSTPLLRHSHRSAGYFVLLAPDVPAVLLELGFMTHAGDEMRLATPQKREAMMNAVADAIDEHFTPVTGRSYAEAGAGGASFGGRAAP